MLIQANWSIKTVLLVHLARIFLGLAIIRLLYLLLVDVSPFLAEIADRLIILVLVWTVIKKGNLTWQQIGLSSQNIPRNVAIGILAGLVLLIVSIFSEKIFSTVLFLTPVQHPLVARVEQAATVYDLLIPLVLAGLAAPLAEEGLYRVVTFLAFKNLWGLWRGAFFSAVVFALMHFNVYWLPEMIVVGMGLALLYYWSGSLISAIVAHAFINSSKLLLIYTGLIYV